MYRTPINTNAIIRQKENGIHSRGFLCSSQNETGNNDFGKTEVTSIPIELIILVYLPNWGYQ